MSRLPARKLGPTRRCLALVALALFGHAVALHVLHRHTVPMRVHSTSVEAAISKPQPAPTDQSRFGDHCPACQLQQGFVFLDATPALLCLEGVVSAPSDLASPLVSQRVAEGSTPSRAPPVL